MIPIDTRPIDVSLKGDIFAPRLAEYWRTLETCTTALPETTGTSAIRRSMTPTTALMDWTEGFKPCELHESAIQRVAIHSAGLKPRLQALLAATWLDWVVFSGEPNQTRQLETTRLIHSIQHRRKASVSVSEKLRRPRETMLSTSLLAPSGAYLSWLAIDSDDGINKG
jgi:hypothetical protein